MYNKLYDVLDQLTKIVTVPLYEQYGTYHHNMTTYYGISWSQVIILLDEIYENVSV